MKATKYGDQENRYCDTSRRNLEPVARPTVGSTYVSSKPGRSSLRVLEAIHEFVQENGFSPSMRELCEATGLKSSATINHHVCTLVHHGLLRHKTGQTRAYSLTPAGLVWVEAE